MQRTRNALAAKRAAGVRLSCPADLIEDAARYIVNGSVGEATPLRCRCAPELLAARSGD